METNEEFCECGVPWIEPDNTCARCKKSISAKRLKAINEPNTFTGVKTEDLDIGIENRTSVENRKVIESLINDLMPTKKYRKAVKDGKFSMFSIVGTDDWEDYASFSMQSLQLLTLANIDENLEKIRKILEEKNK